MEVSAHLLHKCSAVAGGLGGLGFTLALTRALPGPPQDTGQQETVPFLPYHFLKVQSSHNILMS